MFREFLFLKDWLPGTNSQSFKDDLLPTNNPGFDK
jgi:hypothetical protein